MKDRILGISLTLMVVTVLNTSFGQVGIYMSELIGNTYKCVIDKSTGEYRAYEFIDEDGDGWASGVQKQYLPNPDESGHLIPIIDFFMAFEITEHESCGNCMVFEIEDETKKYFSINHEEGSFWIQESDEKFEKWDTTKIYYPANTEETSASEMGDGLREIMAIAQSNHRLIEWGTADDGGSVFEEGIGASFTAESVSSTLPEDENFDYEMGNAFDNDPWTTWFSDPSQNADYPSNESITFTGMVYNESIWILNGMQYSTEDFENNSRVKIMTVYVNEEYFATVTLLDQMGAQEIPLEGINAYQKGGEAATIEFRIVDIYPGKEYSEAGIAEIYTLGG